MFVRNCIFTTLIALLTGFSSGCIWVAAGAAGAGGYYVAKDERSLGTIIDDASVTSSVKAKLIRDDEVRASEINVDTSEGVVTLYGHVPNAVQASRAIRLAKSVKGVKQVNSKLVVVGK